MQDDIPLSPDSCWGIEVRHLITGGYDFDHAFALVMERYLREGDLRPLLELLRHGEEPGDRARKYIAAMIDPGFRAHFMDATVRYEFRFEERRASKRPKRDEPAQAIPVYLILRAGVTEMIAGRKPGQHFWKCLKASLGVERHPNAPKDTFPLKAALVRIGGAKGRRTDPELIIRDAILASFVQEGIDRGDGYDSAIKCTLDMVIKDGKEDEHWRGTISEKTIRNAYDAHSRRKRRKSRIL